MCSPQSILDKIVETVFRSVGRHVGFLLHYKQNLKNLEDEKKNLQEVISYIEGKVNEAEHNGEAIDNNVKVLQMNVEQVVDKLKEQISYIKGKVNEAENCSEAIDNNVKILRMYVEQVVDKFKYRRMAEEDMPCSRFSCPNIISRYHLSKEAKNIMLYIKDVKQVFKEFKINTVSPSWEAPPELVFPSSWEWNIERFRSRERVFKGIVEALKDSRDNIVGVYGVESVGKTTLVKEVSKLLKQDGTFDEVLCVVVSPYAEVIDIQRQLLGCLNLCCDTGDMEMACWNTKEEFAYRRERKNARRLLKRLDNGKKNLILLEDVQHRRWPSFESIGIPIETNSCKVVLTTRNRDVLEDMNLEQRYVREAKYCQTLDVLEDINCPRNFKIEILSRKESWALFMKNLEHYIDTSDQPLLLRMIAWEVCNECHGLPAPIIALGAALKDKDIYAWQSALDKLRSSRLNDIEGIDPGVLSCLNWRSYDHLGSEDAKSCFLLCCIFPEDARIPIDYLVRYYMTGWSIHLDQKPDSLERALDRVCTIVHTLKSRCLLLDENYSEDDVILDEYYSEDFVKLHNVMRDLAVSIAEREKSFLVKHGVRYWPEKATYKHCSVISLMLNGMREFPDQLEFSNQLDCPELHTLRMDFTVNGFQLQVPDRFFSGMENLQVLDLKRLTMSPILPSSLAKLAKLQMLCLEGCELGDIAVLKDLKDHLEILSLRGSNIEVLPPEVGELTRLRVLDMQDCDRLGMISKGVISNLSRLEELYMPFTFGQWEGTTARTGRDVSNASLDELTSLTKLTTLHVFIPDPTVLPMNFPFENLVRFHISVGKGRSYSPQKDSTGILKLENIHLANTLEGLLGTASKSFCHLTILSVTNCTFRYLFSPSSARALRYLKSLEIEGCMEMEGVIKNCEEEDKKHYQKIRFNLLNVLRLKDLPKLISFYHRKKKTTTSSESSSAHVQTVLFTNEVAFPAMKELDISGLPNITDIWEQRGCQYWVIGLCDLHKVTICQLRTLKVINCSKLVNVAPSIVIPGLQNLEELHLHSCPKLGAVFDLGKRKQETEAAADNTIVRFQKLRHIELGRLPNIKGFCTFSSEEQPIFHAQVAFPKLECLNLNKLGDVALWQLLGACELKVEYLNVSTCHKLSTVASPHLFRRLRNVDLLKVDSCIGVTEVFHFDELEHEDGQECIERLTQIRMIRLKTLPQLTCLWSKNPHHILRLQKLEYLTIKDCPLLINLLTASVAKALCGLKVLFLMSCSKMDEVIATQEGLEDVIDDNQIMFPKLGWIILKDLSNLKSFCSANYNFNLPLLRKVVLKRCPNMQTFTSGSIRMPPTSFITRGNDGLVIEDLNKHIQQQDWEGEAMMEVYSPEMDGNEDQFEYLEFLTDL